MHPTKGFLQLAFSIYLKLIIVNIKFLIIYKLRQTTQHKYATIKIEVMNMQENYLKSLQMIKVLNIKTRKEYNKLLNDYLLLSVESLKYISQKDNFRQIVIQAKEVE